MLETESLFPEEEHSNAVQSLGWEEEMKTDTKIFADEPNSGNQGTTLLSDHKKLVFFPPPQKSQILNTLNSTLNIRKKRNRRVNLRRLCDLK